MKWDIPSLTHNFALKYYAYYIDTYFKSSVETELS